MRTFIVGVGMSSRASIYLVALFSPCRYARLEVVHSVVCAIRNSLALSSAQGRATFCDLGGLLWIAAEHALYRVVIRWIRFCAEASSLQESASYDSGIRTFGASRLPNVVVWLRISIVSSYVLWFCLTLIISRSCGRAHIMVT